VRKRGFTSIYGKRKPPPDKKKFEGSTPEREERKERAILQQY